MKGFLPAGLALALVLAGCEGRGPEKTGAVRAVVATRAGDVPAVDPMSRRGRDDTLLHQDDWRQLEFYAADRRPELEQALKAMKGSQGLHVRKVAASVTIGGRSALAELDKTLETRSAAAPFLSEDKGKVSGQVYGGFTVPLKGLLLYGLTDYNGVNVLGAVVQNEVGLSTMTQTFARLHKAHGLIAVDWRSLTLLTAVKEDGTLEVWRP